VEVSLPVVEVLVEAVVALAVEAVEDAEVLLVEE